eukprot:TRINITY_DN12109_c0_g1_i1.p1 TRINITY_DN12109_c0_g1~~TRINITY_DN12109_c0_g1_i1.p1  ORF type:complete len:298 (-),score=38.62 TRINITY_DN12109_c0_g1_i1:137-928(-)
MYDPYWSATTMARCFYFLIYIEKGILFSSKILLSPRYFTITLLTNLWGLRLTWNWYRSWGGMNSEDWRYIMLRKKSGKMFWIVSFLGIHLFPSFLTMMGSVPIFLVSSSYALSNTDEYILHTSLNEFPLWRLLYISIDVLGIVVLVMSVLGQYYADEQLLKHRASKNSSKVLNTGLWSKSRHPNYLFEITFWWGLLISSLTIYNVDLPTKLFSSLGSFLMLFLFTFISIPLIENRMVERRKDYINYQKIVPALFPSFSILLKK